MIMLLVLMGIVKKPSLRDYWSREGLTETPCFRNTVPRTRFEKILKYLHFFPNAVDDGTDRLYKVRPVIKVVNNNRNTVYTPHQNVTVDESLWEFTGRLRFRFTIPRNARDSASKSIDCASQEGQHQATRQTSKFTRAKIMLKTQAHPPVQKL